jgi:hypothetical protein
VFGLPEDPGIDDGAYVQLHAVHHENLLGALEKRGACPEDQPFPVQARGDWGPEEGSYFTSTERLREAGYLRATSVRAIALVAVEVPERAVGRKHGAPSGPVGEVSVRIDNPFDVVLGGLSLVVHYEGGRGKPMPVYETAALDEVAPGKAIRITRPAAVERDGAWYHYASVSLEGSSGGCTFLSSTYRR